MWSGPVVVFDPLSHHSLQVKAPDDQHLVDALPAARADLPPTDSSSSAEGYPLPAHQLPTPT